MEPPAENSETAEKPWRDRHQPSSVVSDLARLVVMLADKPAFKNSGLGLTGWCVLRIVASSQDSGGGRIAGRLGITPQRSAQIVNELVSARFVTSTRSGDDGRRRILAITEAGRVAADAIDKEIADLFQRAFSDSPQATPGLGRLFRKLLKAGVPPEKNMEQRETSAGA